MPEKLIRLTPEEGWWLVLVPGEEHEHGIAYGPYLDILAARRACDEWNAYNGYPRYGKDSAVVIQLAPRGDLNS